jgi:YD repeat-containing protein
VDGIGTTVYAYTIGGQLRSEGGLFADDTATNGYVQRLRTTLGLAQPTGEWTNGFIYDAAGRLTNVTSPAGSFGYVYDALRRRGSTRRGSTIAWFAFCKTLSFESRALQAVRFRAPFVM